MRVGMGMIKNEHGVYHVRRKVPKALEAATATVMDVPKERVSWLKETLRTKDEKRARVLAKPVMMKFDRILARAEALLVEHPVRTELTEAEINQIADYFYAHELGADEAMREEGAGTRQCQLHPLRAERVASIAWDQSGPGVHRLPQGCARRDQSGGSCLGGCPRAPPRCTD